MVDFEDVLNIGENGHERNRVDEKGIRSLEGMAVKYFLLFAAAAAAAAVVFVPVLAIKNLKLQRALYNNLVTEFQTKPQEEIVKAHNVLRRTVYPTARNMLKMSWNKAAATNARILARYCDMSDSDPLERRLNETFCGENRHLDHYPHSWTNIIEIWHNESKHFTYGEWPSSDDDFQTNHYTQMVWATSYLIGCDVASCRRYNTISFLYVCHYCHEGNNPYTLNMPYKEGSPCEDCPNDCDEGLCTNPCPYYDEYNNCDKQLATKGCSHPAVLLFCKASCLCKTEIK
ncbi:cysteine-rich secretory protein 1 [Cricetulus griseus]|uniref:Cysteine-rich secretory protein 1 n=1 Tax=Cricetulus griseus TaxID=10029 RepID=A0A9J7EUJ2_CRIGR|nr:cysteine-rich secretory protein 1 [Cricetulus griseus]XP_027243290.1 cysteine-rich secretory protein 1 [Cricetulus griseus]